MRKSSKGYEKHRLDMARRSRENSLKGRDIAPLPPVKDYRRKERGRASLADFAMEYYSAKVSQSFCPNHLAYIARLEEIIVKGGKQAIAMPRGSGKSTIAKIAAHWAISYGYRRFIMIICATKEEAVAFMNDLKEMAQADVYAEDFPEVSYPIALLKGSALLSRGQVYYGTPTNVKWRETSLVYPTIPGSASSGSVVETKGMTGAMRGKSAAYKGETLRPDLVIIDDPQKDEDAMNHERVAKIERKINRTIAGLVEDGKTLAQIMTCTVMEPGDVADRFLDTEIYPTWHGLRFKMVERFPDNMGMWLKEYASARAKSEEEGDRFYEEHREELDRGAVVDWPERFDPKQEKSRIQRAMNCLIDDADAFYAERQNEPRAVKSDAVLVPPKVLRSKVNGLRQREVPADAIGITGFIDVHDDLLYYCVCAWNEDRTGYVIDYGTWPEQRKLYFFKNSPANDTLKRHFPGYNAEGAVQCAVQTLAAALLETEWQTADGVVLPIHRLCVDVGYKRKQVETAFLVLRSPALTCSSGRYIGANSRPMTDWKRSPGERKGNHWIEQVTKGRYFRTLVVDTNYWKTIVHNSFALGVGDKTGLSLWGNEPERHRMFSEHLNAETPQLKKGGERELYEWAQVVGKDNHLFDCIVGCLAAASSLG